MIRIDSEDFSLMFHIFSVINSRSFLNGSAYQSPCESVVFRLIKEEAEDVIFFLAKNKAEKKIKREIFKRHYEAISGARQPTSQRQYAKTAIKEAYGFFYGNKFIAQLEDETSPISKLIDSTDYGSLTAFLKLPKNQLLYHSVRESALGRFLASGYISA